MTFSDDLVWVTVAEYQKYGGMVEDDDIFSDRIGEYWALRNKPYAGKDAGIDWSGAFVSMMVHLADPVAGAQYSGSFLFHAEEAVLGRLHEGSKRFATYRPPEVTIRPGDILFMNHEGQPQIHYDKATSEIVEYPYYESHADIVVAVDAAGIHTIGGNIANKIGQKKFHLKETEGLINSNDQNQKVFLILRHL